MLRTNDARVQVSQQSRLSMGYCYAIRKRRCQVCFRVNFWADVAGNIAFRLYTIPDGPTAHRYHNFATNVVPVLLVEVLLSVRQVLRFQSDGTEARCGWTRRVEGGAVEMEADFVTSTVGGSQFELILSCGSFRRSVFTQSLPGPSTISLRDFRQLCQRWMARLSSRLGDFWRCIALKWTATTSNS
jgi:hypothetical protein